VDNSLKIRHACIKDCEQMCLDGQMMGVIRDGFERHGITTQIYSGDLPTVCPGNEIRIQASEVAQALASPDSGIPHLGHTKYHDAFIL
jgi:hypothetical protein